MASDAIRGNVGQSEHLRWIETSALRSATGICWAGLNSHALALESSNGHPSEEQQVRNGFSIDNFRTRTDPKDQYQRRLKRLTSSGKEINCIETAVKHVLQNISTGACFVIYGEPQSGKTEMMICLTARLLDEGHDFIVHLLNDSLDLLTQNLGRFKKSGLSPAAKNFTEILDPAVPLNGQRHVVFCKKNGRDLGKLLERIGAKDNIIIIDDEADYASPNSKINSGGRTKINDLIAELLGDTGTYIGVTATPARLDLNNTFENDSELWVHFPAHSKYTGQDIFFPLDNKISYSLNLLPDSGPDPRYARTALFGFLVNAAHLNLYVNKPGDEQNYSFLVHTSGKKSDHSADRTTMRAALTALGDPDSKNYSKYVEEIWSLCQSRHPTADANEVTTYILQNINRNTLIVLNSERDWVDNGAAATSPTSLFTIIIGGNIVSRGVTLDNLLSMFFTRDVKHKIQQDTYIQRARMFGSRGDYLSHFELTIPRGLYADWHRCFIFHRLALDAIKEGLGSLVWLGDARVSVVANASIDRSSVDLDRGEMSFALFDFDPKIDAIAGGGGTNYAKVSRLAKLLGETALPDYLRRYLERVQPNNDASVVIHKSSDISGYKDAETDKINIQRSKGFFGKSQLEQKNFPQAIHHLRVFHNAGGNARLFYKCVSSINFMKNIKRGS